MDKARLMRTFDKVVGVPSLSGTPDENVQASQIYEILQEVPYFGRHPGDLQLIGLERDQLGRGFVSALVRSERPTSRTLIVAGHYDVVDTEECGHLRDLAFKPYEYTKRVGELHLDDDALKDLQSGEWLFGRGVADMKCGIALGIELIRHYAEQTELRGNLLFLAVPDEEANSAGMLGAVSHLVRLQQQGCRFVGLVMLECDEAKHIYTGASGKLNAMFFAVGTQTHVDAPFHGLNANSLVSELNRIVELSPEFCDHFGEASTPPPTCLKQTDIRDLYSVTTPLFAYSYYNVFTLQISPAQLMARLKDAAKLAFAKTLEHIDASAKAHGRLSGNVAGRLNIEEAVISYDELCDEVKKVQGEERLEALIREKTAVWAAERLGNQEIAAKLIRELYELYPHKKPMIVVGFAPPYYPSRTPNLNNEDARRLLAAVDDLIRFAGEEYHEKLGKSDFYTVSDLSYTGLTDDRGAAEIGRNLIGLGHNYVFPLRDLQSLDIEGISFGGWGKGFHEMSERVHVPYTFDVLPDLLEHLIGKVFE